MDNFKLEELLKSMNQDPTGFLQKGAQMADSLDPETRAQVEKQAKSIAMGPMGNEIRKKLQMQGLNKRKLKQMQRTNKMIVKGKKDEAVEKGVLITQTRKLKYFNIFRSQEQVCINNAIGGFGIVLPLFQRLQGTDWAGKGVKVAYNPRGVKENRRAKRFLGPKARVAGDVAVFLEAGSLTMTDVEELEDILFKNIELMQREEEVKKIQNKAKESGLGEGLLQGENVVFGNVDKVVDYGNDEQYLVDDSDDEKTAEEPDESSSESEIDGDEEDEEINQIMAN